MFFSLYRAKYDTETDNKVEIDTDDDTLMLLMTLGRGPEIHAIILSSEPVSH